MSLRPRSRRLRLSTFALVAFTACAPGRPAGPAPSARIASLEPRLVDGNLVVRFEIANEGEVPVALIDGLAAERAEPDLPPFDPLLDAVLASGEAATLELRKGELPTGWDRFFLATDVPVLKTIAPGERFSDVARIKAPAMPFERVRLVLDVVANLPLAEQQTADGPVFSAPLASVSAARWRLSSEATPLVGYEPIGLGGDEPPTDSGQGTPDQPAK